MADSGHMDTKSLVQISDFVTGKEAGMDFDLKEKTFSALGNGLNAGMALEARPGKYRLRVVARAANKNKFTATSQAVEIQ